MEAKKKRLDGKKLKRKVIYVYEDDDGEGQDEFTQAEAKSSSVPPVYDRATPAAQYKASVRSTRMDYSDDQVYHN